VRSGGADSSTRPVTYGVPQGSVLESLLFIIYFNDVSRVIHFCRFHMYADNLQIYHRASISDLQRCYNEDDTDLQRICD
jgi:retron-type reverse transcriptase